MVVRFEKCELKIDEIQKEGISDKNFAPHEKKVIKLIQMWGDNCPEFEFTTSGSTGVPKTIRVSREKILYSCKATMAKIDPEGQFNSSLLCINPEMIGGAMVVFRALVASLNLTVKPAGSNPFGDLDENEAWDLVSLVPLQMKQAGKDDLNRFRVILVGGAGYSGSHEDASAVIYSTFGMTETISHFALRSIKEDLYECTGDAIVDTKDGKLKVKGTITDQGWMETNDLVEIISDKKFRWIGRSDFVINSGGIKLNPEKIEEQLKSRQPDLTFLVSYLDDENLGNKVILIVEGQSGVDLSDFSFLEKYERPKEVFFMDQLVRTSSAKIDRIATREKLLQRIQVNMGEKKS